MAQCVECHPFALLVISLSLLTQFAFSTKVYLMVLQPPRSTIPSPDHFYRHRKKTQLANLLNWPILLSKLCLQERTAAMLCRVMVWYTADETQLAYSQQIKSGYPVQYDLFAFEYYCIVQWAISCIFEVLRDTRQNSRFLARLARHARLKEFPIFPVKI